ncbi:Tetratricopeptide repeat family protein [Granulibacter bethesdensis CGDNIH4]|nr:Tetratricopeptide repeat family protein [Granulibacter bethesdensis CGDNIH4]
MPMSDLSIAPDQVSLGVGEIFEAAIRHDEAGRIDRAESLLQTILKQHPHHADALHLMAVISYKKGDMQQALAYAEQSILCGVNTPLYIRNICEFYRLCGKLDEALVTARRAVELNPGDGEALHNLAIVEMDAGLNAEAQKSFRAALSIVPDMAGAHFGLSEALLQNGEFREGWEEYEWRFRIPDAAPPIPYTDKPQWDGSQLEADETLLLVADQGFGDAIQFGRLIPRVLERCSKVSVGCSPELKPLLQMICPEARCFVNWNDTGDYKAWLPITGLPRIFDITLDNIPDRVPYLYVDEEKKAAWSAKLDKILPRRFKRIGIVWAGRPTHKNDWKRSVQLKEFEALANCPDVAFVILQKGPSQSQVGEFYGVAPVVHLSLEVKSFEDTMAIMAGLDLVISIDTSVAHLAGAIGVPLWLILPHIAEWRWLIGRDTSPWYPTARLFRQSDCGDWKSVFEQMRLELGSLQRKS